MKPTRFILSVIIACLGSACAGTTTRVQNPQPARGAVPLNAPGNGTSRAAPTGVVSLRDAVTASLAGNPGLAAASFSVRAAEARELQASLYPNPELELEVEEFGGGGELSGFDASEYTAVMSQEVPLGGKISRRTAAAGHEARVAALDHDAARRAVLTGTTQAFVEVLATQDLLSIARESVRRNEEVLRAVGEQVAAGKSAPIEERRASVSLSLAKLGLARAENALDTARSGLAAWWGQSAPEFNSVIGDLHGTRRPPAEELVVGLLSGNPVLARWEAAVELHRAKVRSAEAEAWPDLTVAGGVKRLAEIDETAFVAGVSLPLPVFNRNQGGIREARADSAGAEERLREAKVRIRTEFAEAWRNLHLALEEAETLRGQVLPAAQAAFDASKEGFRQGKYGYLQVLDAQRTLFEAKEQLVTDLSSYHAAVAVVEGLIGQSLSSIEPETQP